MEKKLSGSPEQGVGDKNMTSNFQGKSIVKNVGPQQAAMTPSQDQLDSSSLASPLKTGSK